MHQLINQYLELFHLNFHSYAKIEHEDTMSSQVYKVLLKDHSSVILKICFDEGRWKREVFFLDFLKKKYPVPALIDSVEPMKGRDGALLMEYLKGDVLLASSLNDEFAEKMGNLLAQLHEIRVEKYGDLATKEVSDSESLIRSNFLRSRKECEGVLPPKLLDLCEGFIENHLPNLKSLDGPCVVHRDFKPGNVVIDDGQIIGVIDWENAYGSFAEEDFAQMDHLIWSKDFHTRKSFLKGYAEVRRVPNIDAVLPALRVCKILESIGDLVIRGIWNTSGKILYRAYMAYLQRAIEVNASYRIHG